MTTTHDDVMTRGWPRGADARYAIISGQGGVEEGMPKSDDPTLRLVIRFNP